MSNNYASFYTLHPSSLQYNNYVSSQTIGPLNTSQTPGLIRYHSYGALPGKTPNPPKYYPSDFGSDFSQSRFQYSRCNTKPHDEYIARQNQILLKNSPYHYTVSSTQRQLPVGPGHLNYISPIPSSMRTSIVKRTSIGKSSYKIGLPDDSFLAYKSYDKSYLRSRLKRARSGGCIAPAKAGSIFNPSCRVGGGICNRGAIVGQGY
jgi:hypothetical protein